MANANNGRFVWYEHMTKDPKAAIAFYSEVVGWKTQPFAEGGDYMMWVGSQGPLGGVMKLPDEAAKMGAPPHWMGNVQVEDVDATAALAKKARRQGLEGAGGHPDGGPLRGDRRSARRGHRDLQARWARWRSTTTRRKGSSAGTSS